MRAIGDGSVVDESVIRARVAAEREALADVLDGLGPAEWAAPSLCAGWAVGDVVAHITMPFRLSRGQFVAGLVKARGRFNHMADVVARRDGTRPQPELIAALRDNAHHPWKPPGGGYEGALTHDVIHGFDITVALGIERTVPAETMRTVLGTSVGAKSLRFFGVDPGGVELRATDLDWSFGIGEPMAGTARDLALWLTGRPVDRDSFAGRGR